ncbi:helix-turn-helix domain-containing protein [Gulosibacter sp. 10]|uniref:AraC family transcriptional regulator n=1 Tax=Gulosibacter sp. 10 TaxID=1255570 RepID=UPI00097F0C2B|nr:helix-turn-helix domain-containing protein [Gulosibacter sp. 10]SJM51647.1 Transcriptional regulator, AraC family [Gulosibacter sp. 10]
MPQEPDPRGVLYPSRLPSFARILAPPDLADRVRWFWIPRWRLPPGRVSRQEVLPFPASNLVVEPGGVSFVGPQTRILHRDLAGAGWAVGALLRPAGAAGLLPGASSLSTLRDAEAPFEAADLHRSIAEAMAGPEDGEAEARAAARFADWAAATIPPPGEEALLANRLEEVVAADRDVLRVEQLAERLAISPRSLQRLARRWIGLPPLAVIRRYRLQEAAQRLREDPEAGIARTAAELGYADHAHLTADFRSVLGFTPSRYRRDHARPDGDDETTREDR